MNRLYKNINPLLFVTLLGHYFLPAVYFLLLLLIQIIWMNVSKKTIYKFWFPGFGIIIIMLILGVSIGAWNTGTLYSRDIFRDIYYTLTPIIMFIFASTFYRRYQNKLENVLLTFVCVTVITTTCYYFNIIFIKTIDFQVFSNISAWRKATKVGNDQGVYAAITSAVILSGILKKEKIYYPNFVIIGAFCLSALQLFGTFSRTNFFIFIILLFSLVRIRLNIKVKTIYTFFVFLSVLFFLWTILKDNSVVISAFDKIFNSINEISSKNDFSNIHTIQQNWRGYETYSAVEEWKKASFISKLIGFGFGKNIYVGFVANLVSNTDGATIPVLHNGYSTMLVKLGLLGVFLYLLFYLMFITKGIVYYHKTKAIEARLLVGTSLSLMIVTFFLNGLFKDYVDFSLIFLLVFSLLLSTDNYNEKNMIERHI